MSSTDSDGRVPKSLLQELEDIRLAVIKIANISWDLASADVIEFLAGVKIDKHHIHIPIDRSTGKTKADMFVELPSLIDAIRCIAKCNKRVLKGRAVTLSLSSHEELFDAHFPSLATDPWETMPLTIEEAQSIIAICRDYKAHFSRKCAERPFEHVVSVLRLVPWQRLREEQVDILFDLVMGAIESLTDHLLKSTSSLSQSQPPCPKMGSVNSLRLARCRDVAPTAPTTNTLPPVVLFPAGSSPQLKGELLERLLCAANTFPPFSDQQKMDFIKATHALSTPKFGQPIPLTVDLKPARHLRKSSIDRILEELSSNGKRTEDVDRMMKQAFQQIMLSTDTNLGKTF